jgi:hypothetical protein
VQHTLTLERQAIIPHESAFSKVVINMVCSKIDEAPRAEPSGQEMSDEQLSLVLGAASRLQAVSQRQAFSTPASAQEFLQLARERVPVINPERIRQGFDFDIHPDLEDPWPKPSTPPEDPPIPPDLEDPFPPRPDNFPFPVALGR